MKKLLARIKPDCFEDIIAVLALFRPGPLESGMVDMFTRRKHGQEPIQYPHASLEPILRDTYGCIVYQEQVMLISSALGGFALNEADNLRKAMGKKKPEIMAKFSEQFVAGAVKNGCAESVATEIWANILKFGGYGFNKSHSTAYAVITYQTAFLKANFRAAFLAANLSCEMSSSAKVKDFLDDARRSNVDIRPPSIERSEWEFVPEEGAIRYGFGAIKGTGPKAIETLIAARSRLRVKNTVPTLHELCAELDSTEVGKVTWEALIKSGCFDAQGHNRGAILFALDRAQSEGARLAADRKSGQGSLFGGAAPAAATVRAASDGIDPAHAFSRADTLRAEFEALGFYLSGHPLEERGGLLALLSTVKIDELAGLPGGTEVTVSGLILSKSETIVKSGKLAGRRMCRFRLEDLKGSVSVTVFPRTFEENKQRIEEGQIVVARAKLEEGADEPALLLEEILTIEEALGRFQGGVLVSLLPDDEGQLEPLRALLQKHKGKNPFYLQVTGQDGRLRRVRAGNECRVAISESFAKDIDGLLGSGRVKLAKL
jgi:DNA polymerase-3 subunit alpha